jgi:hypothetical protein
VIPANFATVDEALKTCAAMYKGLEGVPPEPVADLIAELDRLDAIGENGFLSMWPVDAGGHGAILCTRWPEWDRTIHTLLEMTKERNLAMVDLQQRQVFDPRGCVDAEVMIANGTKLPYLTEQIIVDVMANQDHYGDYVIVERAENVYVQSLFERGAPCQVEHRAGSADQHFQTLTSDRTMVPRLIWAWLEQGPQAPLLQSQSWQRLELG